MGMFNFRLSKTLFIPCIALLFAVSNAIGQAPITIQPFVDPICLGNSVSLSAIVTSTDYGTDSYTFQVIPYAPLDTTTGTAIDPTLTHCSALSGGKDDCWGGPYDIGFSFCFFSQLYTSFYVGSNGWIGFRSPGTNPWNTFVARVIPNNAADSAAPKDCIFAPWQDWLPTLLGINNIFYYTTGTAPDRQLVVYWKNCPMYGCSSTKGSFQIVLKEQGGVVENHLQAKPFCGNNSNNATQGVHNNNGTIAFTAVVNGNNRNQTSWTASEESMRFVPDGVSWHTGSSTGPVLGYGDAVTFSPTVSTWVYAVMNTCLGVIHFDSVLVHVVPTITGPASMCKGVPGATYVTESGMTNYTWSVSAGGSITSGGTATDNTVTVTWISPGSQTVGVVFTNPATGCTSSVIRVFNVTVIDAPVPVLSGSQNLCVFSPGHIYTTQPGKLNYVWVVTGGTITAGGGGANSTCTVTWTSTGAQSISVSYSDPVTLCSAVAPTILSVNVNPLPTPTVISGETLACAGIPGKVYVTQSGYANYLWTITGGTITSGGGTANPTATVTWTTTGTQLISINYTNPVTLCTALAPSILPVEVVPLPVPAIAGPSNICLNTPQGSYTTQTAMNSYVWTITPSSAGTIISGDGTNSILILWNSPGSHLLTVSYTDVNGCPVAAPAQHTVVVTAIPVTNITAAPGVVCSTYSYNYQTPPDPACTFTWTITPPGSGTIVSGQGLNVVNIKWLSTGSAIIDVTGSNNTYTCTSSSSLPVAIKPTPLPAFTACFDTKTTLNARKITLRGASPFIAGQGVFSGPGVSSPSSGVFEFNPQVAGPGSSPVTYTFTNNYGCSGTTAAVNILVQTVNFTCGSSLTDVRDGKTYPTALFNGSCWMTRNLDYGTVIPGPFAAPQTDNCVTEKYCSPADVSCTTYGGFYQWDEIMQYAASAGSKGACPPEWHLPIDAEWQALIDNLSPGVTAPEANGLAGAKLKDMSATIGFHGLLGGLNYLDYVWAYNSLPLTGTMYWTSTGSGACNAVARGLNLNNPSVSLFINSRINGFSVRCVKD